MVENKVQAAPNEQLIFAGSRMKVERARHFIRELRDEIARFIESDPIRAQVVMIEGQPKVLVEWDGMGLLPGAILGDAVHNLRTALDLMASEMARLNLHSDKNVYFPFADSQESFQRAIESKEFYRAGEAAVGLIWTFAPYRGGNDDLRALHDLDIQDKHKILVDMARNIDMDVRAAHNEHDPRLNSAAVKAHFKFWFPEGTALAGRDIVETLERLAEVVGTIIDAFAALNDAGPQTA